MFAHHILLAILLFWHIFSALPVIRVQRLIEFIMAGRFWLCSCNVRIMCNVVYVLCTVCFVVCVCTSYIYHMTISFTRTLYCYRGKCWKYNQWSRVLQSLAGMETKWQWVKFVCVYLQRNVYALLMLFLFIKCWCLELCQLCHMLVLEGI